NTHLDSAAATVTVCVPPTLTGPDDQNIIANSSATLSVSCDQNCTYAWYQGTSPDATIPGGTGAPLTPPPPTEPAQVCVPTITTQPTGGMYDHVHPVHLSVGATLATSFQWYIGQTGDTSTPVSAGTGAAVDVTPAVDTRYWVRAIGSCAHADSQSVV